MSHRARVLMTSDRCMISPGGPAACLSYRPLVDFLPTASSGATFCNETDEGMAEFGHGRECTRRASQWVFTHTQRQKQTS